MLSVTYYVKNYAGIIGWSLPICIKQYVCIAFENSFESSSKLPTYNYKHFLV